MSGWYTEQLIEQVFSSVKVAYWFISSIPYQALALGQGLLICEALGNVSLLPENAEPREQPYFFKGSDRFYLKMNKGSGCLSRRGRLLPRLTTGFMSDRSQVTAKPKYRLHPIGVS